MAQKNSPVNSEDGPQGDPWQAFSYLVSGVLIYGFLGWLVDRWVGTTIFVGVGIVTGAALGLYMTYARFGRIQRDDGQQR